MRKLLRQLMRDENGMIISAELVLVVTIGVLGMIVGINAVASSINNEMNDIAGAFGAIDQSYAYRGMTKWGHASVVGSGYVDARDNCDCSVIVPTIGAAKRHGGYVAPPVHGHVPHHVAPCDNCPHGHVPHKLKPTPDSKHHHHDHHRKHPPKKPRKPLKGPKLRK